MTDLLKDTEYDAEHHGLELQGVVDESVSPNVVKPLTRSSTSSPWYVDIIDRVARLLGRVLPYDQQTAREGRITLLGEQHVSNKQVRVWDNFFDGVDTEKWVDVLSGSGSYATSAGALKLLTGGTANSGLTFTSTFSPTFIPGTASVFLASVQLVGGAATNCVRRWGAFNATDGYFFEADGAVIYGVSRSNGVDNKTDITSLAAVTDTINQYEIEFNAGGAVFFRNRVAVLTLAGGVSNPASVRPHTVNLPMRFEILNNSGNTTENEMQVRACSISRLGMQPADHNGIWDYYGGASGTVNVDPGRRVVGITAIATSAGASMTINSGQSVPIPNNTSVEWRPKGYLRSPTIVFTGTASYIVEVLF